MKTTRAFISTAMIGLLFAGMISLRAETICPGDCGDNPDPNNGNNANDPVFFFPDPISKLSAKDKAAQLRQQVLSKSPSAGQQEQVALQAYEAQRKSTPRDLYAVVLDVWGREVSPELKQYVILSSLSSMRSTEQVEVLKFMLGALSDLGSQKQELARLSKGNGLMKAQAARLMDVLNRNPQLKF